MGSKNSATSLFQHSRDRAVHRTLCLRDFHALQDFLKQHSGIFLTENKRYLVQSRLGSILQESGCASVSEMIQTLIHGSLTSSVRTLIIDTLTTNETFWFRDPKHFKLLRNHILPKLACQRFRTLRIWSAACSTGQEPYSIAMCALDAIRNGDIPKAKLSIIGTDLSQKALDTGNQAIYSDIALSRGLPDPVRQRYFLPYEEGWKLKPEICELVKFQQFNLLKPYDALGKFDLIFCRNVLIYFSPEIKSDILRRMATALQPGGILLLGSTETMPSGLNGLIAENIAGVHFYQRPAID